MDMKNQIQLPTKKHMYPSTSKTNFVTTNGFNYLLKKLRN